MFGLDPTYTALLIFCLLMACAFEFINGFHDTANAVATVIYTNSLKPWVAVIWSGILNGLGVFWGGITVAMGISSLIPVEVFTDPNLAHNIALILSLLITAILWNLGTWYYGIPCSSSHTLVGSILGVGLAFGLIADEPSLKYVNWSKAGDIGLSLVLSPLAGFSLAIFLMYILNQVIKNKAIFKEPDTNSPPPTWIRVILISTCSLVSFFHGSNDGQKGVGLIMLIMIAVVPSYFAIDQSKNLAAYKANIVDIQTVYSRVDVSQLSKVDSFEYAKVNSLVSDLNSKIVKSTSFSDFGGPEQIAMRKDIILIGKSSKKLMESEDFMISSYDKEILNEHVNEMSTLTDYAPKWVILMIAISLGLGTMVGWKRIVKTIGEKIGKQHLTYAQGASSELVASATIGMTSLLGLPVSTTQVLSSGIAGSMVASKGIKNLQGKTIKNIFIAWALTLPVTVVLAGGLFLLFRAIF
jgi:PiT family inorganic phosphate transporter